MTKNKFIQSINTIKNFDTYLDKAAAIKLDLFNVDEFAEMENSFIMILEDAVKDTNGYISQYLYNNENNLSVKDVWTNLVMDNPEIEE